MKYREEKAVVEKIDGGDCIVRFVEPSESQCARCGLCKGTASTSVEQRCMRIPADSVAGSPQPGETVIVHVPDIGPALSGIVVLGIPLSAGLAALIAAAVFEAADWAAILLGGAGFAFGWMLSYFFWGKQAKPFVVSKPNEQGISKDKG